MVLSSILLELLVGAPKVACFHARCVPYQVGHSFTRVEDVCRMSIIASDPLLISLSVSLKQQNALRSARTCTYRQVRGSPRRERPQPDTPASPLSSRPLLLSHPPRPPPCPAVRPHPPPPYLPTDNSSIAARAVNVLSGTQWRSGMSLIASTG